MDSDQNLQISSPSRIINLLTKLKTKFAVLDKKQKTGIGIVALSFVVVLILVVSVVNKKYGSVTNFIRRGLGLPTTNQPLANDGFTKLQIPQRQPPFFTLTPANNSRYGILPGEKFVLKTEKEVNQDFLRSHLTSSTPVTITKVGNTEYKLTPTQTIEPGGLFSVSLPVNNQDVSGITLDRNYGWTFQAQEKFKITGSIPGNEAKDVPVNTGIEIVFSQDDYQDPKGYLEISPSINFRTEVHENFFSIVPLSPLKSKTIYTITLKKGLNLNSRNDPLNEDFSYTFQTADEKSNTATVVPSLSVDENFLEVSPSEAPQVKVFTSNWNDQTVANTKVFRFNSAQQFLDSRKKIDESQFRWWSYFQEDNPIDTSSMPKVFEGDLKVTNEEYLSYIKFPKSFDEGYYLIQFWLNNGEKLSQLWLQSTTIAGFVSVGRDHTLVWVNNVQNSSPTASAEISLVGSPGQYSTNDQGISEFSTPSIFFNQGMHYLSIRSTDEKHLLLPVFSQEGKSKPGQVTADDYWSYLYHERTLYKSGDTLNFWGVVRSRLSGATTQTMTAKVSGGGWGSDQALFSKNISASTDGTFRDSFSLENVPDGWYDISILVNNLPITSVGFQVKDYQTPEMKIEVTSDKNAVFLGDNVKFDITTTFFDGTPASNIPLKIVSPALGTTEVKTNNTGQAEFSYAPKQKDNDAYYPYYESDNISPALAQTGQIEGTGSVLVFGPRLMITPDTSQDGSSARIKATINKVTLDKINRGESANDAKGDPAGEVKVKLDVTKSWTERVEAGTYYDYVEKVTRPKYDYIPHSEKVIDTTLTSNTQGEIFHEFQMEEERSYQAILTVTDEFNNSAETREYFYYYKTSTDSQAFEYTSPELVLDQETNLYSLNEEVKAHIIHAGSNFKDTNENRFLFIVAKAGIQDFYTSDNPNLTFTFSGKHVPNAFLSAIIFTGKYYQTVSANCRWEWQCNYWGYHYNSYTFSGLEVRYKTQDKKLDLTISFDKETYKPGEEVNAKVLVTKNGSSVTSAEVNIDLVDEALEAIGGVVKPKIMEGLYSPKSSLIYYNYYSHKPLFPTLGGNGAERGGGGGEYREIFKDTAVFATGQTDESGLAEFSFTLPDDITTWLAYAQAVTSDLSAGQTENKIVATKDFFVTVNFPRKYLVEDKAFLSANSFGKDSLSKENVSYETIIFDNEKEKNKQTKQGFFGKDTLFEMPKLSSGNYAAGVTAKAGSSQDGVRLPFDVTASRFGFETSKRDQVGSGSQVDNFETVNFVSDKPVKLIVGDIGKGKYYNQLIRFCYEQSNRLEKLIAKRFAGVILEEKFDEDICSVSQSDLEKFVNPDGGLSLVWWGSSNLDTTTWAAYVTPNSFSKNDLERYFEVKQTENQISSLWGLTSIGIPKITQLKALQKHVSDFDDKVKLGISLAASGEVEIARNIYYDLLADYGYENKPYVRIQTPLSANQNAFDTYARNTSYVLLLGSLIEPSYNEGMFLYLRDYEYTIQDVVLDLAKTSFIKNELSKVPDEDTQVVITSLSRNQTVDLAKGKNSVIKISPAELPSLTAKTTKGKSEIVLDYYTNFEGMKKIGVDDRLKIKRSYREVENDGKITPGDIVEITVDYDLNIPSAPYGGYIVTDFLPSGFSKIKNPGSFGLTSKGWASENNDNVIIHSFYNSPWWDLNGTKTFIYFARAMSPGTYIAEPAIIQSQLDLSVFNSTEVYSLTIEPRS